MLEGEVFELVVDAVQSEPVGDRRIDLERFAGDAPALLRRQAAERAHVVQAVRELDQNDAYVARHGEQHLAEALGLMLLVGGELDAVELGDTVHQLGDALAELARDLALGDRRVFHDVVQQRGGQRLRVEMQLGEDVGDRERVDDVGIAGLAELTFVCGFGEVVGGFELRDVLRLQVAGEALEERLRFGHGSGNHGAVRLREPGSGRSRLSSRQHSYRLAPPGQRGSVRGRAPVTIQV